MKALFPDMTNRIGTGHVIGTFVYWLFAFVMFPFLIPLIAFGLWNNLSVVGWLEIVYHCINAVAMSVLLKDHLEDCVLYLQIETKVVIQAIIATVMMMVSYVLILSVVAFAVGESPIYFVHYLPLSEMNVSLVPGLLASEIPIFGTICLTVFTPFALCGLFYAPGFAPMACKKPWLGYIIVSVVLLLPVLFNILWRDNAQYYLFSYVITLPVHLLACWSYQKTDNVCTPIICVALFNLFTSVACMLFI